MDKNEAIKIIHSNFPTGRKMLCEALEILIPELKENEDDRMRKMAIKAVNSPEEQSCIKSWGVEPKDVIARLEKQGEQKSTWSEEDERMCKNLLFLMEQENSISSWEGCYEWLKSLKQRMKGE